MSDRIGSRTASGGQERFRRRSTRRVPAAGHKVGNLVVLPGRPDDPIAGMVLVLIGILFQRTRLAAPGGRGSVR